MKASTLYDGFLRGEDVYIVGLGPSLQVTPMRFLRGKVCILLKDAWALFPKLGPVAFSTNTAMFSLGDRRCQLPFQIVKARHKSLPNPERDDNHVPWDHPDLYCFSYRERPWDSVSHFDESRLWLEPDHYWNVPDGSVSLFAIQFAVLAGARNIFMVGCDCGELADLDYCDPRIEKNRAVAKQKLIAGKIPKKPDRNRHNYDAYRKGLSLLQYRALKDFSVPVLTITPFAGLFDYQEQFKDRRAKNWS